MPSEGMSLVSYVGVFLMIIIAPIVSGSLLLLNKLFGKKPQENTLKKYDTYECGVEYVGDASQQFSVRYYLVAILFLLFDVEVVFMYPWTQVFKTYLPQGHFMIWEVLMFSLVLVGGYVYLRLRGAFNWD